MKSRELKALIAVAEELHFGRAAERLGMAQPQLSALIRRIEADTRVTLFIRRPHVRLTHGGAALVDTAREMLAGLEAGVQRARAIAAGRAGRVKLGFSPVAMCSDLPEMLRSFAEAHPDVELDLCEGTTAPLQRRLEQAALDVIITREAPQDETTASLRFAFDHINLILPARHPAAAAAGSVEPGRLRGEAFTLFPRAAAPEYHDRIMRWAADAGLQPVLSRETDSWMASIAFVGAGLALAFGTDLLSRIAVPGIVYRNLAAPPLDVSFWMSWQPGRLSPAALRFVEHVRATRP
ncbi:LysR family transcriptional regulator [Sphingosinicella sp. BN140058]|uniref:LysR family transcriptional regulator n=1 Tax=Sphingosinicella sp. BN140058 TaxID=1892855 RepID=UPI001010C827|nr:LysR family transcriptional regulator [Sphingosinicella sp. BN140058]QAY76121.1 LysR family transcriptional regulator [Sphingosinicella sp. BN140058]